VSADYNKFWANVPEEAIQAARVTVLEALRRIDEPLPAVRLVDVLDGDLSMAEAAYHLSALEIHGVVEPVERERGGGRPREDGFDVPYRLVGPEEAEDG
jgi:DNA-binding transcriptional ArsR family regulator